MSEFDVWIGYKLLKRFLYISRKNVGYEYLSRAGSQTV